MASEILKLTLVTILFKGVRYSRFFYLEYVNGKAVMPETVLNQWLDIIGVRGGQTYSIG